MHDDPIHRADGTHHADLAGAFQHVDAHGAGQPHAADKRGQDGHDEQENDHDVNGEGRFLAQVGAGFHALHGEVALGEIGINALGEFPVGFGIMQMGDDAIRGRAVGLVVLCGDKVIVRICHGVAKQRQKGEDAHHCP